MTDLRPVCLLAPLIALALLLAPATASADEVAPELESMDLRVTAQAELRALVGALPATERRRLVGVYAAFDANAADPFAQVACDDDGDYVVLISDAMLRLAAHVARAATYDDSGRRIAEYAAFVARSQIPGRRLLPPPPGFFAAAAPAGTYDARLAEALAFVVARELAHLRAGDLLCPRPTATKESGDDTWTNAEQRNAAATAVAVYPGRQLQRDDEATSYMLDAGRSEEGALALLGFFEQLESEARSATVRFRPSYAAHHPNAAARAAAVRRSASAREATRARSLGAPPGG